MDYSGARLILRYIFINGRVVSRACVWIKRGMRIKEGQIIRAIVYISRHILILRSQMTGGRGRKTQVLLY